MDEVLENLNPETQEILLAATQQAFERKKAASRTATEIALDTINMRPYSIRLTGQAIHRLHMLAGLEGQKPSELARLILEEGIARLESQYTDEPQSDNETIKKGVLEHLNAVKVLLERMDSDRKSA